MTSKETDFRVLVLCSRDGTNDGGANDTGELQGETISSVTTTADSNITVDSDNTLSVTWQGVTYSANTTITVWLSGGTAGTNAEIEVLASLSDGRELEYTLVVPVVA